MKCSNTKYQKARQSLKSTELIGTNQNLLRNFVQANAFRWNGGPLSILYKCKMQHSKVINPEDYPRITETMATFGVDCSTIATWSKNKVRKQIAKGIITAAWGNHKPKK